MQVRLNKWLNELEQMFYGMSFAFDKSLSGDENITGALLRNFYNDDKSKQKAAETLARYTTRWVSGLPSTPCKITFRDKSLECVVQGAGMPCQD